MDPQIASLCTEFIGWKGLRGTRHAPAGATLGTGVRPITGCGEEDGHWAASQYIMMSRCRAEVAVARHQEVVIIMFSISRGGIVWYGYSYSMGMGRGNNNIYSDCTLSPQLGSSHGGAGECYKAVLTLARIQSFGNIKL